MVFNVGQTVIIRDNNGEFKPENTGIITKRDGRSSEVVYNNRLGNVEYGKFNNCDLCKPLKPRNKKK